ncbi:MAG: hypothetical protein BTN85_1461 [Candidatus Methanohalarchaeum thermophilum]|uniref:Uncharacterized protein n=1 Tax=Methanohalarchaeum thermophilum TaxID=1903181 RepID=A0A1Q6DX69_METT1|nr:MAG: hypothetical protein BTN85_1461 [Candidatus Methanohalarchaeum thermophilum]
MATKRAFLFTPLPPITRKQMTPVDKWKPLLLGRGGCHMKLKQLIKLLEINR